MKKLFFCFVENNQTYGVPKMLKAQNLQEALAEIMEIVKKGRHYRRKAANPEMSLHIGPLAECKKKRKEITLHIKERVRQWALNRGYSESIAASVVKAFSPDDRKKMSADRVTPDKVNKDLQIVYRKEGIHSRQELIFLILDDLNMLP